MITGSFLFFIYQIYSRLDWDIVEGNAVANAETLNKIEIELFTKYKYIMSIFYYQEHAMCPNYASDQHVCFKYMEVEAGVRFSIEEKKDKHIFFFLEGSVKVRYNEFPDAIFNAGEMIFLPKSADCKGEALTHSAFIVLVYDNPMKLCEKATLESIMQHAKHVTYDFESLPIVDEMRQFLVLLRRYLLDGINCGHLHEIKQKELFLLLRAYYKKEKLAQFFFPMIGKSMDFRSKVMAHYLTVRTAKELASACLYSERQFYELFMEEFGEPPYQWMQKQKSKHIIGKLYEENMPIKDIVNEFGFTSQSHFNKYCIKQFGNTPIRIRQKLLVENQQVVSE